MRKWTFGLAALGLSLFIAGTTLAQNQPGGNGQAGGSGAAGQNGGGGRGGRGGNFDPTQMRANMMDRIKTELGATDEEWTAIQPRLSRVLDAQRDARAGGRGAFGGGFGGRRGQGGAGGGGAAGATPSTQPVSAVAKAQADLKAAIDNKDTPPAELASKLATLRDAKEKAKSDLVTAQKSLKELLTQRQEAILVNMGMLD